MKMATAFVMTHESNPQRTAKSTSIIALAIMRSLGRRGVPVVRIHPNRLETSLSSRYCRQVEVAPDFYQSEADLLAFLLAMPARYPGRRLLIPASDDCAWFIAKYHAALSGGFSVVSSGPEVMADILDKKRQYERAGRLGIPIPETWFPGDIDELGRLAPTLANYPYVIKPLVAHRWRHAAMAKVARGRKGVAVHHAGELLAEYEAIAQGDGQVMIQEVIGGADDRLFTFLAYCDAEARPLGYCIRKKLRQLPLDFGYCTLTVSCHDEVVADQSIRLLSGLGFHGIGGVEWKLDPRTGQYKLIEVNPRAVNTLALAAACGVDLPWIAYADVAGEPFAVTDWADGVKWINFDQDVWAALELHRQGRLGFGEWWRSLAGPRVDAVYAGDDLRPFVAYFRKVLGDALATAWKGRFERFPGLSKALPGPL